MPSERQIEVARRLETDAIPVATQIVRETGYSDPEAVVTRVTKSQGVLSERARIRQELRSAATARGLTTETFIDSLKTGLADANSGTQRLYAELFDLIDTENRQQVLVVAVQLLAPVFLECVPEAERGQLRANLRKVLDASGAFPV